MLRGTVEMREKNDKGPAAQRGAVLVAQHMAVPLNDALRVWHSEDLCDLRCCSSHGLSLSLVYVLAPCVDPIRFELVVYRRGRFLLNFGC